MFDHKLVAVSEEFPSSSRDITSIHPRSSYLLLRGSTQSLTPGKLSSGKRLYSKKHISDDEFKYIRETTPDI
jgi:hypothetical protein